MKENEMDHNKKDDCKELSGSLTFWTDESIRWYERASDFTGYHRELKKVIEPYLNDTDRCCELACGTGTLARTLSPLVSDYLANDIDTAAAAYMKGLELPAGMNFLHGDWHDIFKGKRFDVVLFSFFGAMLRDWDRLVEMADRSIIAVLPRKRKGHRKPPKEAQKTCNGKPLENPRSYETAGDVEEILDSIGVPYTCKELNLEFGQPFVDMEDALRYIMHYYRLDREKAALFAESKLEERDGHYYFPKEKEIAVIVADTSGKHLK